MSFKVNFKIGRAAALLLGAAACALSTGSAGLAQGKPAKLPDWRGVWAHVGSFNIDPTSKTGAFQANAPLNAAYLAKYKAVLASRAAGRPQGDIGCLPEGPPRNMRSPYPLEVVPTPDETWINLEFKHEVRRVYTDGRKPPADLDPTYEGYSTGHWEGDTLVFDTVGLKAGTMDSGGLMHSDALTLHERLRRVDHDTLEDQVTMTDPKIFTKPWTVTRTYKLQPTWEIKEFVCEENERNPITAGGKTGITLEKK